MMSTPDLSKTCCCDDRDRHCLTYEQVKRLHGVLSEPVQILPKEGNFPTLAISPSTLARAVSTKLHDKKISVLDVRLNGSGASFCLAEDRERDPKPHYNDLDIIFRVEIKSELDLHVIKDEVLNSLYQFFPEGTQTDTISIYMLEESYVKKRVKVSTTSDLWSLISLGDDTGKNIELKFVQSMKRQYEFSVDSFQIILDPLLEDSFAQNDAPNKLTPESCPRVQAITLYEDFSKAMYHLNNRLIATHNPEEIRGGGLLKYCYLLVSGYQHADLQEMECQEPYMCSRFFIDFSLMNLQFSKIQKYIGNRFLPGAPEKGLEFLQLLMFIIAHKAKCLMDSERFKTMRVLQQLHGQLLWHYSGFYKYQLYQPTQHPFCHFSLPTQSNLQQPCRSSKSSSYLSQSNGGDGTANDHHSSPGLCFSAVAQPLITFPHTQNNAVPLGPTPTPVR